MLTERQPLLTNKAHPTKCSKNRPGHSRGNREDQKSRPRPSWSPALDRCSPPRQPLGSWRPPAANLVRQLEEIGERDVAESVGAGPPDRPRHVGHTVVDHVIDHVGEPAMSRRPARLDTTPWSMATSTITAPFFIRAGQRQHFGFESAGRARADHRRGAGDQREVGPRYRLLPPPTCSLNSVPVISRLPRIDQRLYRDEPADDSSRAHLRGLT